MEGAARPYAVPDRPTSVVALVENGATVKVIHDSNSDLAELLHIVDETTQQAAVDYESRREDDMYFKQWFTDQYDSNSGIHQDISQKDREIIACRADIVRLQNELQELNGRLDGNQAKIKEVRSFLRECADFLPGARDRMKSDAQQLALLGNDIRLLRERTRTGLDEKDMPLDRNLAQFELEQAEAQYPAYMKKAQDSKKEYEDSSINQAGSMIDLKALEDAINQIGVEAADKHRQIIEIKIKLKELITQRNAKQRLIDQFMKNFRGLGNLYDVEISDEADDSEVVDAEIVSDAETPIERLRLAATRTA